MRWTERQRAMLREMGVQIWSREPAPVEAGSTAATATAATATAVEVRERVVATPTPIANRPAQPPTGGEARLVDASIQPADWLVVGDPLDAADPQQEQLLDNLLRAIGASRTASSRERRAAFVDDPARVAAAISSAGPRCVIALGRAAAAALLGRDEPIGAWRGRSHRHGEVPVVVTFALAFLLRHPAEKAKAWLDLCLAVGCLGPATSTSTSTEPGST